MKVLVTAGSKRQRMDISVVGLGKLGMCLAASLASKGYRVVGVDINPAVVGEVRQGRCPLVEPGLKDLMASAASRLTATLDYEEAIQASDVTFIIVPTPSTSRGAFSLKYVCRALEAMAGPISRKSNYHVLVLTSTVVPGSMEYVLKPFMEQHSGKRCGEDFGFCYSPVFIALGDVLNGLLRPAYALIGSADDRSAAVVEEIYRHMCENNPPLVKMNYVNAEVTKLASNCLDTTKVTFANMIADICHNLPGANVDSITEALGHKNRGARYLKGAIPYGGPCFPRDNLAMVYVADRVGRKASLARAVHEANQLRLKELLELVVSHYSQGMTLGVAGLSYKLNTDVTECSFGLGLVRALLEKGASVAVYDPHVYAKTKPALGGTPVYCDTLQQCVDLADVMVVANALPELQQVRWPRKNPFVIIDCWRALTSESLPREIEYVGVGRGDHARLPEQFLTELHQLILE
ncbi:MAG: UDP-glucose/GDP-mannose dehydrogenase family protein [Acidobacteria bacterium]|nr:UDP-glucose/GDP-mannose dehydrogenase family protein [Acidobacteriota bacterium]